MARLKQGTATSAGGIVIRDLGSSPQLVLCRRLREHDGEAWTLPKGTPNQGETTEETALREVREETGLTVAPNDSHELARAVNRILDDKDLASRLSTAARARALSTATAAVSNSRSIAVSVSASWVRSCASFSSR